MTPNALMPRFSKIRTLSAIPICMLLATVFLLMGASPALAHATLESLSPEPDAVLAKAPTSIVLQFSEPISATPDAIRVFDPSGSELKGIVSKVENGTLSAGLPSLAVEGSYTVAWKMISADGHALSGAYLFHLREATLTKPVDVGAQGVAMTPRVLKVVGSILTWIALATILGLCAAAVRSRFRRRELLAAWGAVIVGTLISLWGSLSAVGASLGRDLQVIFDTSSGKMTIGVAAVALVGLVIAGVLGRRAIVIVALVAVLVASLEGHALSLSPIVLSASMSLIHVVAGIIWLGGLLWIEHRSRVADPAELRADIDRRSPWAMGAVALLLLSGLALFIARVPVGELLSSGYGRLGSVKLILLAMAVSLAWVNRSMISVDKSDLYGDSDVEPGVTIDTSSDSEPHIPSEVQRSQVERFRRSVRWEMLIVVLALVVGTVLAQVAPPSERGTSGGSFDQKATFGDGQVTLTVDPGKRGMNEVHVTALGTDGRLMAGIDDLKLSLVLPSRDIGPLIPDMQVIVPGHSVSYTRFPFQGEWRVKVTATVNRFDELSATFDVPIGG